MSTTSPQKSASIRDQTIPSPTPPPPSNTTPPDSNKVGLTLLFVNGQRHEGLLFDPTATTHDIINTVMDHWPSGLTIDKPEIAAQIKLLHRGKFLEGPGNITEDHKIPVGEVTIVHIIIKARESVEGKGKDGYKRNKNLDSSSSKCCIVM